MNIILSRSHLLRPTLLSLGAAILVVAAARSNPESAQAPDERLIIATAREAVSKRLVAKLPGGVYVSPRSRRAPVMPYFVEVKPSRTIYKNGKDQTLVYFTVQKFAGRVAQTHAPVASGWYAYESKEIHVFDENLARHVLVENHPLLTRKPQGAKTAKLPTKR